MKSLSYEQVHDRLKSTRGRAATHRCVGCGEQARDWAYNHSEPEPLISKKGSPYSQDLKAYDPMCSPCHKRRDRLQRRPDPMVKIRAQRAAGIATDGDIEVLSEMVALHDEIEQHIAETVRSLREDHGYSWTDIGRVTGVSRQAAQQRWGE